MDEDSFDTGAFFTDAWEMFSGAIVAAVGSFIVLFRRRPRR